MNRPSISPSFRALVVAAVAGFITLAPSAKAKVVYTAVNITVSGTGMLKIDLNHDGTTDVTIVSYGRSIICAGTGRGSYGSVYATPNQSNTVVASGNYALALRGGTVVSSNSSFYYSEALMEEFSTCLWPPHGNYGAWLEVSSRYLGLSFQINGQTHYGWARMSVGIDARTGPVTTLTGYAYETIADHPITTGVTSGP